MQRALKHWRGNLALLALALAGSITGLVLWNDARSRDSERQVDQYRALSNVRHARMLGQLRDLQNVIDASSALFSASSDVAEHEFHTFSEKLRQGTNFNAVCWTSGKGSQTYAFPLTRRRLCEKFDPLEPSRVVAHDTEAYLFLSQPTKSRSQSGFVSAVFPLERLFLEDPNQLIRESLVVSDVIQAKVDTYSSRGEKTDTVRKSSLPTASADDTRYLELLRFDNVHVFYVAEHNKLATDTHLALAALLAILGFLAGVFVRTLLIQREVIASEVRLRTEELSQFAYRTSHDLRAPLVSIGGLCRAALEDVEDGELSEVPSNLQRIIGLVAQLDQLVKDILDLSRSDLYAFEREEFELRALVEDTVATARAAYKDAGVDITVDEVSGIQVSLPRGRLAQILGNLVSNGAKYAHPDRQSWVKLSAVIESQHLQLVVRDNGMGIPEDKLPRLFEAFQRFHPTVAIGSGMGMAIVKRHVEKLAAQIDVKSDPEGTVVSVSIPV